VLDKLDPVSFVVNRTTGRKFPDHLSDHQSFVFRREAHLSSGTFSCTIIIIIIYVMTFHC